MPAPRTSPRVVLVGCLQAQGAWGAWCTLGHFGAFGVLGISEKLHEGPHVQVALVGVLLGQLCLSCPHACARKPPWATKAGDWGPFAATRVAHARAHWHKGQLKGPLCAHVPTAWGRPHHPPAALRGAPGAGTPHAGAGSRGVPVALPGAAVSPRPQGATCPQCSATLSP